jgi:hypothetical protein
MIAFDVDVLSAMKNSSASFMALDRPAANVP